MKYKTLARLLVKLIGVYFLAMGSLVFIRFAFQVFTYLREGEGSGRFLYLSWFMEPAAHFAVGGAFIYFSRAIADRLIPSNRPYCHECGYELTGAIGNRCPECGTAFQPVAADPEPHH